MNWPEILSTMSDISSVSSGVIAIAGAVLSYVTSKGISKGAKDSIKMGDLRGFKQELEMNEDLTYDRMHMNQNFVDVAEMAVPYYSRSTKADGKTEYDIDWFMRFYDSVGHISDEYLKDLWARLLAGEVARPTTYSLRTIETLRTISVQEARLFNYICPHLISAENHKIILPSYKAYLKHFEIKYADVLTLSETGVIYMEGALKEELILDLSGKVFYVNGDKALSIKSTMENDKKIKIPGFPLTRVGTELQGLFNIETTSESFLMFCNEINKTEGVSARVCDSEKMEDGNYKLTY